MARILESFRKTLRDFVSSKPPSAVKPEDRDIHYYDGRTFLMVENDEDMILALGRALKLPCDSFLITEDDSVSDILQALQAQCKSDYVLYVDAQLVYRECPSPSYYGGIELVKHIRLTPLLEPLSLLPIVVGTIDSRELLLRQAVDNIVIFSLGCKTVELPSTLSAFRRAATSEKAFSNEQQMHALIKPFILFTEGDERMRSHTYLNRAGVRKFLKEFGGMPEEESTALQFGADMETDVWLKKLYFLHPELSIGEALTDEESARLRSVAAQRRVIFIDDEHRRGWSYGLYRGLYRDHLNRDAFQSAEHRVESPDKRLLCIDSFGEASDCFRTKAEELERELNRWAQAEHLEQQKSYEERAAAQKQREAQQNRESVEKQLQNLSRDLQLMEKKYQDVQAALRRELAEFGKVAADIMDATTSPSAADPIADILEKRPSLRSDTKQLSQTIDAYEQVRKGLTEIKEKVSAAGIALRQADEQVTQTEKRFKEARQQRDTAAVALQEIEERLSEVLPYSIVFLDLRLVPAVEEGASVVELSGIKLLEKIKESFPQLNVIVMTASEKAMSAEKARELGADGYWIKGVSSGNELMEAVVDCLHEAELQELWLKLKMIEKKEEIHCYEWNRKELEPYILQKTNLYRVHMIRWLEESLQLLERTSADASYSYNYIIFNMYLVQELRIKLQREDDWGQFSNRLPADDQNLRKRRNDVAHARRTASNEVVKRAEALRFIRYTIERLLKERHDR